MISILDRSKTKMLFLIVLFLSILTLILFALIIIIFLTSHFTTSSQLSPSQTYKYTEFNLHKQTSTSGFVQLPKSLEKEEFLTYATDKSVFLISNFGGTSFECTGSCFCQNARRTTASTAVLSRGLFLLFSAFSTSMAMKIAGKVFQEECVVKFSDECADDSIKSEVDDCSTQSDEKQEEEENGDDDRMLSYRCSGHCIEQRDLVYSNDPMLQEGFQKYGPCFDMKLERNVNLGKVKDAEDLDEDPEEKMEIVKKLFAMQYLHPFCVGSTPLVSHDVERWKQLKLSELKISDAMIEMLEPHEVVEKELQEKSKRVFHDGIPFCVGRAPDGVSHINCVSNQLHVN